MFMSKEKAFGCTDSDQSSECGSYNEKGEDLSLYDQQSEVNDPSKTLWVGNVAPYVTLEEVVDLFKSRGHHIKHPKVLPESTCAFVNFNSIAEATKAMQDLQGFRFKHQFLKINYKSCKTDNSANQRPLNPKSDVLWIGNIGTNIEQNGKVLRELLKGYEVLDVAVKTDYAFARFSSVRCAAKALNDLQGTTLNGKKLSLNYQERTYVAQYKPLLLTNLGQQTKMASSVAQSSHASSSSGGQQAKVSPQSSSSAAFKTNSLQAGVSSNGVVKTCSNDQSRVGLVSGTKAGSGILAYGGLPAGVYSNILAPKSGKSSIHSSREFSESESSECASNHENDEKGGEDLRLHNQQNEFYDETGKIAAPSKSLWVGNVASYVTLDQLVDLFKSRGHQVISPKVLPESTCAFVNFESIEEATKAMQDLQGFRFEHQILKINYASFKTDNSANNQRPLNPKSNVLWIGHTGLSVEPDGKVLRELFKSKGYEIIHVIVKTNYTFVMLSSVEKAMAALNELQGTTLNGIKLFFNYQERNYFAQSSHGTLTIGSQQAKAPPGLATSSQTSGVQTAKLPIGLAPSSQTSGVQTAKVPPGLALFSQTIAGQKSKAPPGLATSSQTSGVQTAKLPIGLAPSSQTSGGQPAKVPPGLALFSHAASTSSKTNRPISDTKKTKTLHLASKAGQVDELLTLLEAGADINAVNKEGYTALHIASYFNQCLVIEILVNHGANVDCRSNNNVTPLYIAAEKNHIEIVKILLENKANKMIAAQNGKTPLLIAQHKGHNEIAAILAKYYPDKSSSAAQSSHVTSTSSSLQGGVSYNAVIARPTDSSRAGLVSGSKTSSDISSNGGLPPAVSAPPGLTQFSHATSASSVQPVSVPPSQALNNLNLGLNNIYASQPLVHPPNILPFYAPTPLNVMIPSPAPISSDTSRNGSQNEMPPTIIGEIIVYEGRKPLGIGSSSRVYEGEYGHRRVAVKRFFRNDKDISREIKHLSHADQHQNIVRYFSSASNFYFHYIALELCAYSLFDFYAKSPCDRDPLPPLEILYQICDGIHYLHSLDIVHRDLKPQNVLISKALRGKLLVKISDFGLAKSLDSQCTNTHTTHGNPGTHGWTAPEVYLGHETAKSADIFSMGCVFYFVLTDGKSHPFGEGIHRQSDIVKNLSNTSALEEKSLARILIERMIQHDPESRPDAERILDHPLFWSEDETLKFLVDVINAIWDQDFALLARNVIQNNLERNAVEIIGYDWRDQMCPVVQNFLQNPDFKPYDTSMQRLLRVIRNLRHHFTNLSSLPGGLLNYFTTRFPKLLWHVFNAIISSQKDPGFVYHSSKIDVFTRKYCEELLV